MQRTKLFHNNFSHFLLFFFFLLTKIRFQEENLCKLDDNQRAMFAGLTASCWLDFRLQIIGVAMVSGVAIIAVLEHHFQTANAGRPISEYDKTPFSNCSHHHFSYNLSRISHYPSVEESIILHMF